jgi:hypothetical protein
MVRRWLVVGAALAGTLALPGPAQAGRLVVTGHDADGHCAREAVATRPASCAFVAAGVNWVRAAAPDPSRPVLILDRAALDLQRSVDVMNAAGASVPYVVVEPRSPEFAAMPINTATYSAVLIASSKNEASDATPQDLNEFGSTPDTDAINARRADLAAFFNAGGGIKVMSGGVAGRTNSARYYAFLNITRGGSAVSTPFSLTPLGRAIGWQDGRVFPGELDSINCCDTHISFEPPAPESALKVAEVDSAGRAVTLVAQTDDLATIEEPPTTARAIFGDIARGALSGGTGGAAGSTVVAKATCVPRKALKISLRRPRGVRFTRMAIYVNGARKRTVSGRTLGTGPKTKAVSIKLSAGKTSRLRIVVTTASGRTLTYRRTYKPCRR